MVLAILVAVDQVDLAAHWAHVADVAPPAHLFLVDRQIVQGHARGVLAHRALLNVLQTPGRVAHLAGAKIPKREAVLTILAQLHAYDFDPGARARHANEVQPGVGQLLTRDAGEFLALLAILVLHRQIEAHRTKLVGPDAQETATPAPAIAPLTPGPLLSHKLFALVERQIFVAKCTRLVFDCRGALAEQQLPSLTQAPVRHAEEDMVDHAVGIAVHQVIFGTIALTVGPPEPQPPAPLDLALYIQLAVAQIFVTADRIGP